jgi:hypothetical protein
MKKLLGITAILLFGFASIAAGDSFRCQDRIVKTGDSKMDVIGKCGTPDYSEIVADESVSTGSHRYKSKTKTKKVEKLYYNCGSGRFNRILTFVGGKLETIETGDYGSGDEKCN